MALVGLKDIHVALFNDGTYEVPVKLAKAIEAKITPNTSSVTLYADDGAAETASSMGDIEVELNIDDLPSSKYALIMGKTANTDGVIVDNSSDVAPYLALGFRSMKSNGEYRYVWLYKGKFELSEETYKTKGEEVEFQTPTVKAKFLVDEEGNWRAKVDSDDEDVKASVIGNWFKNVYKEMPTV
ncbi:major tail protein [Peribacillus loiseleuriae]|uniref:Phage tail protein n=1 Tax=Peribacillus loiseleuriae TaxID=1679170 RepID=A0A0K9GSG3_9BACI|nr:major tail protein [Peribacillus loiseleuriae]KMY49570.1 phage tail protein [Peribacillus loiseleuriae]